MLSCFLERGDIHGTETDRNLSPLDEDINLIGLGCDVLSNTALYPNGAGLYNLLDRIETDLRNIAESYAALFDTEKSED